MGAFISFFQRVAHAIQGFLLFLLTVIAYLPGMIATFFILLWNVLPLVIILALIGIPAVLFANNQCTVLTDLDTILQVNNAAINAVVSGINEALDVLSPVLYINNAFWNFVFQAWDDLFRLLGCTPGQRCQAFEDLVGWFQHCIGFFEEVFLIVYSNIRDFLLGVDFSPLGTDDLSEVLGKARSSIDEHLERARNGTARVHSKVSGNDFVDAVKGFFNFVSNPAVFIEIYNILKFAVEQGIQWITQIFKLLIGEILPAFQWLKDNIFSGFFGNVFIEGFTYMKQTADLVVDFFTTVFPQLLATLANFFSSLPGIIANAISSAITNGVGGIGGIVSGAFGGIGFSAKRDAMTDAAMFPATPMPAQIEPPAGFAPPSGWDAFARSQVNVRSVPPCSTVLNHFDVYYYASAGPFNRVVLYACAMLLELESGATVTPIADLQSKALVYADRAAAMAPPGALPLEQRPLFRPAAPGARTTRRSVQREQAESLWERVEALASHPGLDGARASWHRFLKSARTSAPPTPVPVRAREFQPDLNGTMSPEAQHFWAFVGTQPSLSEMGEFLLHNRYVSRNEKGRVEAKFSFGDVVNPGGITGSFSLPSINVGDWFDSIYNSIFHCDRSAAPAYYCLPFVNPHPQIGAVDITIHWGSCCAPCQDCSAYQSGWAELHYLLRRLTNSGFISIDKAVRPFFELPVISFLFGWLWNIIVDFTTFGTNGPPANGDLCFGINVGYLILFFALLLIGVVALAAFGMIVAGVLIFAAQLIFAVFALVFFFIWSALTIGFRLICCCNIPTIEERVDNLENGLVKIKKVLEDDSHRMLSAALQHPRMFQTPYALAGEYMRGQPEARPSRPHIA